jgi:hypothetical protein
VGIRKPRGSLAYTTTSDAGVQFLDEIALDVSGISQHVVVDVPVQLVAGLAEVLLGLACSEDVQLELASSTGS